MSNATQNDAGRQQPAPCPVWCVNHREDRSGHPDDHVIVHRTAETKAAGQYLCIQRYDFISRGRPGSVHVMLGDEFLTSQEATALAGSLAMLAATAAEDETAVRVMDLPDGRDFVVFEDIRVVAISSRLDEDGRIRALNAAGVG